LLNKLEHRDSTKDIRLELHRDTELTIAELHSHHSRLALESLVLETEEKANRLSDRKDTLDLKEDSRCADVARGADSIV
jgi:hypothetical protein